jgi:hypothetical protein
MEVVEDVPASAATAARSAGVRFIAVMLESCSALMVLSIWLITASISCEAAVPLDSKDCNVSHKGNS